MYTLKATYYPFNSLTSYTSTVIYMYSMKQNNAEGEGKIKGGDRGSECRVNL
jgi:hypothetical protein